MRKDVFQDPIEIVSDLRCELDARHDYRASARGFGLTDLSLDSRCSR